MKKFAPKVSIVTAMYNHKPFLKRRVDSVLSQTLPDWEWIIVDDCSTDGSYEYLCHLAQNDSRITILQNDRNRNTPYSTQRALELAQGEFLYRMDSDDYCAPRFLERLASVMAAHPSVVLAYSRGLYMDQDDGVWGAWPRKKAYVISGWEEFQRILIRYHIKSPTILFRRETVVEVGGLTTLPLKCNYDWHLSLRVCLLGDVAFIDEPLAAHRGHDRNVSADMTRQTDAVQMEKEMFGVIDDVLARVPPEKSAAVQELRRAAYESAAQTLLPVADWARANAMPQQATELVAMIEKYVPIASLSPPQKGLGVRLMQCGQPLIKPLTYKKLQPVRQLSDLSN